MDGECLGILALILSQIHFTKYFLAPAPRALQTLKYRTVVKAEIGQSRVHVVHFKLDRPRRWPRFGQPVQRALSIEPGIAFDQHTGCVASPRFGDILPFCPFCRCLLLSLLRTRKHTDLALSVLPGRANYNLQTHWALL